MVIQLSLNTIPPITNTESRLAMEPMIKTAILDYQAGYHLVERKAAMEILI